MSFPGPPLISRGRSTVVPPHEKSTSGLGGALLKPKRYPLHNVQIRRILNDPRQKKTSEANGIVELRNSLRLRGTDDMGVKLLARSLVVVESAFGVELPKEIASDLIHLSNVEA
jgi:hypothetical protein